MSDLAFYLALFPAFSREKPRFAAMAEAVLRQVTDLMALVPQLASGFSFALAEGIQLDALGESVRIPRQAEVSSQTRSKYDTILAACHHQQGVVLFHKRQCLSIIIRSPQNLRSAIVGLVRGVPHLLYFFTRFSSRLKNDRIIAPSDYILHEIIAC